MRYKHIKTGNIYQLINIANECDTEKFPKTVVYLSEKDSKLYARSFQEFLEKFEFVGDCDDNSI